MTALEGSSLGRIPPHTFTRKTRMFPSLKHPGAWAVTLTAAGILMITMGMRQSIGLYVSPINTSTGLGIVTLSLALAIGQFVWGAIQPIAGALADRRGPRGVLLGGCATDGTGFGHHASHDQWHGPGHHVGCHVGGRRWCCEFFGVDWSGSAAHAC